MSVSASRWLESVHGRGRRHLDNCCCLFWNNSEHWFVKYRVNFKRTSAFRYIIHIAMFSCVPTLTSFLLTSHFFPGHFSKSPTLTPKNTWKRHFCTTGCIAILLRGTSRLWICKISKREIGTLTTKIHLSERQK